jgi:hypothetical protein
MALLPACPPYLPARLLRCVQGTQSTRFFLYDSQCQPLASSQVELPQIYPRAGWVGGWVGGGVDGCIATAGAGCSSKQLPP